MDKLVVFVCMLLQAGALLVNTDTDGGSDVSVGNGDVDDVVDGDMIGGVYEIYDKEADEKNGNDYDGYDDDYGHEVGSDYDVANLHYVDDADVDDVSKTNYNEDDRNGVGDVDDGDVGVTNDVEYDDVEDDVYGDVEDDVNDVGDNDEDDYNDEDDDDDEDVVDDEDIVGDEDDVGRIVFGKNTKKGDYPSMVYLYSNDSNSYCGGSLIDRYWILTAAHCFKPSDTIFANVGHHDMEQTVEKYWMIGDKFIQHPFFNEIKRRHDIALLRLPRLVYWTKPLPIAENTGRSFKYRTCTAIGWGRSHYKVAGETQYLKAYSNYVVHGARCFWTYKFEFNALRHMCLRGPGSICKGDSGGPLLCDGVVAGVASYSSKTCFIKPSVFTRVSFYNSWIKKTMKTHNRNYITTKRRRRKT